MYRILNTVNGRSYIGSATDMLRRFKDHEFRLNANIHFNSPLLNAWKKYSSDSFRFEIVMICDEENLLFYEERAIKAYIENGKVYNIMLNAKNRLGVNHTKEAKEKMSKTRKCRIPWNKGISPSQEIRKRISETLSGRIAWPNGRVISDEQRLKISEALQGHIPWNKGKKVGSLSNETRRKISESLKGCPPTRTSFKKGHPYYPSKTGSNKEE